MRRLLLLVCPLAALAAIAVACGSSSSSDGPPVAGDDAGDATPDGQGPGVDNGAPSTKYPAPHPPLPTLVNAMKGPVLTTPKIAFVFYPGDARVSDLEAFARKVAGSAYWTTTTSEYGVGALSYTGMFELTGETAPATIGQAQIGTLIGDALASGKLGVPDPQTIYTLVFPAGTTVTQPNPVTELLGPIMSCVAFSGYHDNVPVALSDAGPKTEFAYAVIPTCDSTIPSLTSVMSHEWIEAATDPQLTSNGLFSVRSGPNAAFYGPDADHAVWSLLGGGEAGDLCEKSGPSIEFTLRARRHAERRRRCREDPSRSCIPSRIAGCTARDRSPDARRTRARTAERRGRTSRTPTARPARKRVRR